MAPEAAPPESGSHSLSVHFPELFLHKKPLQSFVDHGFLVRELPILDLTPEKLLKFVCKSDVHRGESYRQ